MPHEAGSIMLYEMGLLTEREATNLGLLHLQTRSRSRCFKNLERMRSIIHLSVDAIKAKVSRKMKGNYKGAPSSKLVKPFNYKLTGTFPIPKGSGERETCCKTVGPFQSEKHRLAMPSYAQLCFSRSVIAFLFRYDQVYRSTILLVVHAFGPIPTQFALLSVVYAKANGREYPLPW